VRRVLVTGGIGFVGKDAIQEVARRRITVDVLSRSVGADGSVAIHAVNLTRAGDETAKLVAHLRPIHLLLCGRTTQTDVCWHDPDNWLWVEVTRRLGHAFFGAGGRRAVLVGSGTEYLWSDPEIVCALIREEAGGSVPETPYERANLAAWLCLLDMAPAGASAAECRLFFPMEPGPSEDPRRFLPSVLRALIAGKPGPFGPGDQLRDAIDVRAAGAALLDRDVAGPLSIGSGQPVSLSSIAGRAEEIVGQRELLQRGALPRRPGESAALVADVGRLSHKVAFSLRFKPCDAVGDAAGYLGHRMQLEGSVQDG
jgi:nucleoside-diphosphate-sugar epimerase